MGTMSRAIEGIAIRRHSDADVFDRALRGDAVAFSEVYRRYHDRVFAFCLSRLLSREAATDAAQEVFVRILSADPATIRHPTSWLFGIANHVCIDVARRSSREAPAATDDSVDGAFAGSAETDAADAFFSRQAASDVLLALRRTKPRYRTALILREIHQQPMDDVAEALGVSVATAYTILSRARDAFGTAYAGVLDLPNGCRSAVEMIYRRTGTGLSQTDTRALEAHLDSCTRCRREADRAEDGSGLRSLLPLLPLTLRPARGLIARAAAAFGSHPWPVETAGAVTPAFEWTFGKVFALALAAGTLATVVASTVPATRASFSESRTPRVPHAATALAPSATLNAAPRDDLQQTRLRLREEARTQTRQGAALADPTGAQVRTGSSQAGPGPSSPAGGDAASSAGSRSLNGGTTTGGGSGGPTSGASGSGGAGTGGTDSSGTGGQASTGGGPPSGSGTGTGGGTSGSSSGGTRP
jgi:RNA polymerase sigma factor (sigma-70 family)